VNISRGGTGKKRVHVKPIAVAVVVVLKDIGPSTARSND
jgi:hypothetical protein